MIRRITRTLTTGAASLALVTVLAGPVAAQGVPTVDTQNIAQEIRQLQQMVQDFGLLNRPGFTGGQNSRRIARYGTDI
jgi:type IV secretion system protein VirB5